MSAIAAKQGLAIDHPLMDGDYQRTTLVETAPNAFVYRAVDPLGDVHLITELGLPDVARRKKNGQIYYAKSDQSRSDSTVAKAHRDLDKLSRLHHPCLIGIQQQFSQNDTLYFSTEQPPENRTVTQINAAKGFYEPSELESLSRKLISLLAYVHSFEVFGFTILPETVTLADEPVVPLVELRRFLDGTLDFELGGPDEASADCKALAQTICIMLTGDNKEQVSGNLKTRLRGFDPAFLDSIDRMMADDPQLSFSSADDWLNFIRKQDKQAAPKPMALVGSGWRTGAIIGAGVACALLLAGYFVAPQTGDDSTAKTDETTTAAQTSDVMRDDQGGDESLDLVMDPSRIKWTLDLPLTTSKGATEGAKTKLVMSLLSENTRFKAANPWFEEGQFLTAVNGTPVSPEFDFKRQVLDVLKQSQGSSVVNLTVHDAVLPLEREVALIVNAQAQASMGSVTFGQQAKAGAWELRVVAIANSATTALRVGDRLVASDTTSLDGQTLTGLYRQIKNAEANASSSLDFDVVTAENQPALRDVAIASLINK